MATDSLPSYPEMILKAIKALNKEKGSNKSSISKYIESTYSGLPDGHKVLLNLHLEKMKENGELVFWRNNYSKCHPNTPPRQGRGRPPKSMDPQPLGTVLAPLKLRGRCRPPKSKDAKPLGTILAPMKLRGCGRLPKCKDPQSLGTVLAPLKLRGHGCPPKDPNSPPRPLEVKISSGSSRPRGRPRKIVQLTGESNGAPAVAMIGGRRPRGRPPKKKAPLT